MADSRIKSTAAVRAARSPRDLAANLGLADVALARATGAPRIDGNSVVRLEVKEKQKCLIPRPKASGKGAIHVAGYG